MLSIRQIIITFSGFDTFIILLIRISMESDKGKNKFVYPFINNTNVSADLPSAFPPLQDNKSLRAASQHMIGFTQATTEKCIEQALISTMRSLKEGKFSQALSINQCLAIEEQIDIPPPPQIQKLQKKHIFVKKDREKQYDYKIALKWRQKIKKFIDQQIKDKLKNLQATEQQIQQILISLLYRKKRYYDYTNPKYKNIVQKQKKIFQEMLQQKRCQQTNCLPLLYIVQNKLTQLQIIYIQYEQKIKIKLHDSFGIKQIYSINALEFFKIIHDNKFLTQVTVRGVQILQFSTFIEYIYELDHSTETIQTEYLWIKNFAPSKSLKLAICAEIYFRIDNYNEDSIHNQIKQMQFFRSFFSQLSQIKAIVQLPYLQFSQNQGSPQEVVFIEDLSILKALWNGLREIKKLKLSIESKLQQNLIGSQQIQFVRSNLFGRLASLTNIAQLSLKYFQFSTDLSINEFLAIEQSLTTLFQNNTVTHLEIRDCSNFPILPEITTLQSINFQKNDFRKNTNFLNYVAKSSSPSLRSILCQVNQYFTINQQLFNQLQTLYTKNSNSVYSEMTSQIFSNLKRLDLWLDEMDLSTILPKLNFITQLYLYYGQFGHQLLFTIPSPYLQELHIYNNSTITNFDLQMINQKWPSLNSLTCYKCRGLIIEVQTILKFNQLQLLKTMNSNFREKKDLVYLLSLGMQIDID